MRRNGAIGCDVGLAETGDPLRTIGVHDCDSQTWCVRVGENLLEMLLNSAIDWAGLGFSTLLAADTIAERRSRIRARRATFTRPTYLFGGI